MKTSDTPNLDYLKEKARILSDLLNDPHPGLMTWVLAYSKAMQAISNFWMDPFISEDEEEKE